MIIDSHHHLWNYSTEEYGWIDDSMSAIARDFMPADLQATAASLGVVGSVAVQARQTLQETRWLLDVADNSPLIQGVVGWAPLASPEVEAALDEFSRRTKLKGYRHVVQDEPNNAFILGGDFNRGVERVLARDLVYDILIFERQLGPAIEFVDRHPTGRFVLDHIAKPKIAEEELEPWRTNMLQLAQRDNVACKISGIATEAKWDDWTLETIRPYLDVALDAFGPQRLMFGSDWPVCLLATDYARWLQTMQQWTADWSLDERAAFYHGTATAAYGL